MPPRNVHTLGSGDSRRSSSNTSNVSNPTFRTIWDSIPPVTRAIVLLLCTVTSAYVLQLVHFGYLIFQWNETFRYFQLWRMITSCMILPAQAMPALFEIYNIFTRSAQLENEHFFITSIANPSIDYTFYICFCILFIANINALVFGTSSNMVLTSAFTSCLTFTWAVDNANTKILFYGVLPVYGKYYPLITLAIAFIFGEGNFFVSLIGILVGYIFLCLDTRTFGPIWGFITKKSSSYGRAPGGKFCAPRWFVYLYETIFRIDKRHRFAATMVAPSTSSGSSKSGFKGNGSRLGGTSTSGNKLGGIGQTSTKDTKAPTNATSSGLSTTSAGTGNFRGSGQRLGAKEE
ncbi:similar to Saccharomyces cerevisiae YDR411C DFM1 Endoplasmic reticulum (ER) localized protein involved in ER-associated protein degradation (ERAD), ER stress and homeostasis [Maudiozyma saulgeensis]|uniref:Derlin n=1 Tax=Maudiozyma saulgeensis TaxID=1789683 RepID=A0A1X7R219_9SACH|nr:similar to Saccharomyces cerevisiae YDR411C DFM1 Endoplasmic reticulum (ER) localized protein involved in ER-associated protein degradation (ERAD), ER stress and homeostasis [Kazachstania saulgeensis]